MILVMVSIAVINTMTKSNLEEEGISVSIEHPIISITREVRAKVQTRQELRGKAWKEAMEECCLLVYTHGLLICFLIVERTTFQALAQHTVSQAGPHAPIINQENTPQTCPQGNLVRRIFPN